MCFIIFRASFSPFLGLRLLRNLCFITSIDMNSNLQVLVGDLQQFIMLGGGIGKLGGAFSNCEEVRNLITPHTRYLLHVRAILIF